MKTGHKHPSCLVAEERAHPAPREGIGENGREKPQQPHCPQLQRSQTQALLPRTQARNPARHPARVDRHPPSATIFQFTVNILTPPVYRFPLQANQMSGRGRPWFQFEFFFFLNEKGTLWCAAFRRGEKHLQS